MASSSDGRGTLCIPGMVNLHSHAFQRGMAGLAERAGEADDSFWTWREVMYRFLDRLTPDDVEAIATLAYVEMLEAGFTHVVEFHYLHHDTDGRPFGNVAEMAERIAAAASRTGIGLTLLPVLYANGGFGGQPPIHGQRRFINTFEGFCRLHAASVGAISVLPQAVIGMAPHSLRAVTPDDLARLVQTIAQGPIHMHVAEQEREVADCLAWSGRRPVEWLLDTGLVDARWCLIHATHMTMAEVARVAASDAVVGLCPITEANLGDGIFPGVDYRQAGGHFGIGTDSNVLISMTEELRTLEYGQRLRDRRRNRMADPGQSVGRTLHDATRAGGLRAAGLGLDHDLGRVLLRSSAGELAGRAGDDILDAWIFASGRPLIDEVWIGDRRLVSDGRHVARDAAVAAFSRVAVRFAAA